MNETACWRAVESRDAQAAGRFFYGVLTTGIFCRPGCASRTPKRENVRFFASIEEAEALGYRPCRRCRPDRIENDAAAKISTLRRRIEAGEEKSLEEWAAEVRWSPAHLQKVFKAATGLSPASYAKQVRLERLKLSLREARTVTEAMNEAGFSSSSRLHETSVRGLGMTAAEYKSRGQDLAVRYAFVESPVGPAAIAWTARGVCFAEFTSSREASLARLAAEFPAATLMESGLRDWQEALAVLGGPVDLAGSVFQRMVWNHLRTIPPGETRSYSQVAAALGHPGAARAVARACATNRIAVGIPCHRVVAADGKLAGYRWGVDRKRELLRLERASEPLRAG